jgi:hypothetical protein
MSQDHSPAFQYLHSGDGGYIELFDMVVKEVTQHAWVVRYQIVTPDACSYPTLSESPTQAVRIMIDLQDRP